MQEITRPPSLSTIATDKLRQAIIEGTFKLGDNLSENELADLLSISKTPVRHALAQMKVEGLVEVRPQKGTYVFSLDSVDLPKFAEHRIILEQAALDLAIKRNLKPLITTLEQITAQMPQAHETKSFRDFLALDAEYHNAFFSFCDNEYLCESYSMITAKHRAISAYLGENIVKKDMALQEHYQMLDLLNSDDPKAAIELLATHIRHCTNTKANAN
ncbi:GntR family transcriptional regulator [Polycladidibacter stylochi]|uniref:GntR family transcriptional regulator n=1 Tax=Polycladidibacter stylochi TaxID=1807766 RepID=UPI00082B5F03|nr:GntR family transcriptional regulator [Pseudovibrio stylochi]